MAVGNRWQPLAIVGNVGSGWYLLAANRCQHFFAVMFEKHHIFAPTINYKYFNKPREGRRR